MVESQLWTTKYLQSKYKSQEEAVHSAKYANENIDRFNNEQQMKQAAKNNPSETVDYQVNFDQLSGEFKLDQDHSVLSDEFKGNIDYIDTTYHQHQNKLSKSLRELENEHSNLKNKYQSAIDQSDVLKLELSDSKRKLTAADTHYATLQSSLDEKQAENDRLQAENDKLMDENQRFHSNYNSVFTELDNKREEMKTLSNEMLQSKSDLYEVKIRNTD